MIKFLRKHRLIVFVIISLTAIIVGSIFLFTSSLQKQTSIFNIQLENKIQIYKNQTYQFNNITQNQLKNLTFKIANSEIAEIKNGIVYGKNVGETSLLVTENNKSGSETIKIEIKEEYTPSITTISNCTYQNQTKTFSITNNNAFVFKLQINNSDNMVVNDLGSIDLNCQCENSCIQAFADGIFKINANSCNNFTINIPSLQLNLQFFINKI